MAARGSERPTMRRFFLAASIILSVAGAVSGGPDAFPLAAMTREAVEGMNWSMNPITLGSQTLTGSLTGWGAKEAAIGYDIGGSWEVLEAYVGYTKNTSPRNKCRFSVVADQIPLYTSGEIAGGQEPEFIRVPVEGKKIILLRIEPITYGATLNACFAQPTLKRGLTADQKATPYQVEVNGSRVPYDQVNAPANFPIMLPITGGQSNYQVKIVNDTQLRKLQITTTPTSP